MALQGLLLDQELSGSFSDPLYWFLGSSGSVVLADSLFSSAQEVFSWLSSSSSSSVGEQKKMKMKEFVKGVGALGVLVGAAAIEWPLEIAVVWLVARFFQLNISPLDEEHFRERDLVDLGPGLAMNYWIAFLKPLVEGPNFPEITKLLLIPTSCTFDESSLGQGISDEVVKIEEDGSKTTRTYEFDSPRYFEHWRGPMTKPVTEVVGKNSEGEEERHLVIFDFPRILESSMGPSKNIQDSHRQANRKCFVTKIEEELEKEGEKGKAVKILVYDESELGFCLADKIVELLTKN